MGSTSARTGPRTRIASCDSMRFSPASNCLCTWQAHSMGPEAKCSFALLRAIHSGELQSTDTGYVEQYSSMLVLPELTGALKSSRAAGIAN